MGLYPLHHFFASEGSLTIRTTSNFELQKIYKLFQAEWAFPQSTTQIRLHSPLSFAQAVESAKGVQGVKSVADDAGHLCMLGAPEGGDSKGVSGAVSPRREAAGSPLVDEPPAVSLTLVATNIPLGLSSGSVSEVIINLCPSARDIILENNPRDPSQRAFFSLCEGDPVPFKSTPFVQVGEVFWSFGLTRPREKVPESSGTGR
jgi:hypothetical protein